MSAAFDGNLIYQVAHVVGKEARAFGNNAYAGFDFWTLEYQSIHLEIPGDPNYIYNLVTGLQGGLDPDVPQIISTGKHCAVDDVKSGRDSNDLNPTARDLSEYYMYLIPFKAFARDAKVGAVICSYNAVDGIPSCANRYLMQTKLRDRTTGLRCPTVSMPTIMPAVQLTQQQWLVINAGTDLGCETSIEENLVQAVAANVTTEVTLDQSLSRLYTSLLRLG
jgi:beta-D-xylosidase 4